ncbi:histidine--tRNA ligase [Candidatus Woesearchaeota archaeon]|nr:histidine--tRNA ligase [Candidatus Woesearchaeota archaeon]
MELSTAKGTRDIAPERAIARQKVMDTLRAVFELYGFSPLETPVIERYDLLASKYAGGAEILKETFKLKDQGGRELALRYDLTVPLCRFIGMNPNIKMPFKRYQIANVLRDGPMKKGRYREFWQCDVDTVGVKEMTADSEFVMIAQDIFKRLGLKIVVKINSRKVLNGMLAYAGIKEDMMETVILSVDKLEKFGMETVKKELKEKGLKQEAISKVEELLEVQGTNPVKITKLKNVLTSTEGQEGLKDIEQLFSYLQDPFTVSFEPTLARGLAYYTGTVFEVFLVDNEIKSAVAGGGRYDKMIQQFLGSKQEFPAVGISFGLDVIIDALKIEGKEKTVTKVYIIPIGLKRGESAKLSLKDAIGIAQEFRNAGIAVDIDLVGRGVSKNLEYANALGIPFVAFIGEEEMKLNKVKIKNMQSGEEKLVSVEDAVNIIQG